MSQQEPTPEETLAKRTAAKLAVEEKIADWSLLRDSLQEFEAEHAKIFESYRMIKEAYNLKLAEIKPLLKALDLNMSFSEGFRVQRRVTVEVNLEKLRPYLSRQLLLDHPNLVVELNSAAVVLQATDMVVNHPEWVTKVNGKLVAELVKNRVIPAQEGLTTDDVNMAAYVPTAIGGGDG